MIYHDEDPIEFAKKYGINLMTVDCRNKNCDAQVEFTKPFSCKGYRGVEAGNCLVCGTRSGASSLVPVGEKVNFWNKVGRAFGIKNSGLH